MVVRAQVELAADAIDLGRRRFFERRLGPLENRARVHQRPIEYQLEEIVTEIVMRRDIALAAGFGVAIEVMEQPAHRIRQPREAAVDALGHGAIAHHDLHERGQVVGAPRARHVRLGGAHAACEREVGIKAVVVDANRRAQIGVSGILTQRNPRAAVFDHEAPAFDPRQTAEHRAARETIENRRPPRPRRLNPRRNYGIRLRHSRRIELHAAAPWRKRKNKRRETSYEGLGAIDPNLSLSEERSARTEGARRVRCDARRYNWA